jgi:hypothetical protein
VKLTVILSLAALGDENGTQHMDLQQHTISGMIARTFENRQVIVQQHGSSAANQQWDDVGSSLLDGILHFGDNVAFLRVILLSSCSRVSVCRYHVVHIDLWNRLVDGLWRELTHEALHGEMLQLVCKRTMSIGSVLTISTQVVNDSKATAQAIQNVLNESVLGLMKLDPVQTPEAVPSSMEQLDQNLKKSTVYQRCAGYTTQGCMNEGCNPILKASITYR